MELDACGAPSAEAQVRDMGELLLVCRRFYLTMFEDGLLTARPESAAAFCLSAKESGPAGDWPADAATQPVTIAVKLVRQQADYLAAIGTLLKADEVFDPIMTLLRGAFEVRRTSGLVARSDGQPPCPLHTCGADGGREHRSVTSGGGPHATVAGAHRRAG